MLTMGLISVYLALSIGNNYAIYYSKNSILFSLVSLCSFLIFVLVSENIMDLTLKEAIFLLGAKNMFISIIISFFSCYLFRVINFDIFADRSIPSYVLASLNSIFPFLVVSFLVGFASKFFNLSSFLSSILDPLKDFGDNIVVVLITNIFLHLSNFVGIHGISIVNSVFLSLWQGYLSVNGQMVLEHKDPIYITAYPFFQWFIWIGGAGSTLGLNILLLFSKNSYLKNLGRSSILFSVFNINEPLLFGLPVVFNPYFFFPFVFVPIILSVISFMVFYFGLVNKVYIESPWMFPSPFGAFLSTTDYRAVLLNLFNIFISMLIYYPFLKAYENSLEGSNNDKDKSK
jgi:PTS system cellobiose-specific IIC component